MADRKFDIDAFPRGLLTNKRDVCSRGPVAPDLVYSAVNVPELLRCDWEGGFVPPAVEGQEKFRLLVHAFPSRVGKAVFMIGLMKEGYQQEQNIDLLANPMDVHKKKIISSSVIDQDHRATYGEGGGGLILAAPFENVLKMSPQDSGSNFFDPDAEIKAAEKGRNLRSLDALMSSTMSQEHNEIRLTGETKAGRVKVVGFFIKTEKDGSPVDPEMAAQITMMAGVHGLPVHRIKKPLREYKNEGPKLLRMLDSEPPFGVGYARDACRFNVCFDHADRPFTVINDEGKERVMTRAEATGALAYIAKEFAADKFEMVAAKLEMLRVKIPDLPEALPLEPLIKKTEFRTGFERKSPVFDFKK